MLLILSFLLSLIAATARPSFSKLHISPLLHKQALSHIAFHSNPVKLALASLFSPSTIAIVGVEWGEDLILFAENNYTVYAFEPASKFVKHLDSIISQNPHWNASLIPIAAGNKSDGTVDLRYDNEGIVETVRVGRVDHHVHEPLGVFSLDIQGDELHVLEGSSGLLTSSNPPASLWIEAIACNPKVIHILEMLHERYTFFDFVPWGKHKDDDADDIPLSLQSFLLDPDRPSTFSPFLDWMCEAQKRDYKWLQTDFLAVRNDMLKEHVVATLASLAETACQGPGVKCQLRLMLASRAQHEEKEEL